MGSAYDNMLHINLHKNRSPSNSLKFISTLMESCSEQSSTWIQPSDVNTTGLSDDAQSASSTVPSPRPHFIWPHTSS